MRVVKAIHAYRAGVRPSADSRPSVDASRARLGFASLVCMVLLSLPASAAAVSGRVIRVSDGDTLTLRTATREIVEVRLAEIDAPERGQPWGDEAKEALAEMTFGEVVRAEVQTTDSNGRKVARVYLANRDINRELVEDGHAWVYPRYLRDETLLEDEGSAREEGLGLWGLSEARRVPPWEWRRQYGSDGPRRSQRCGAKRYCGEMASCAEAWFYLNECGVRRLDGDRDGVPCEDLCR